MYPSNTDELFSVLQNECNAIPNTCFNLITDSSPTTAAIAKMNNGKSTKY